jgi:hypothetical protein
MFKYYELSYLVSLSKLKIREHIMKEAVFRLTAEVHNFTTLHLKCICNCQCFNNRDCKSTHFDKRQ